MTINPCRAVAPLLSTTKNRWREVFRRLSQRFRCSRTAESWEGGSRPTLSREGSGRPPGGCREAAEMQSGVCAAAGRAPRCTSRAARGAQFDWRV